MRAVLLMSVPFGSGDTTCTVNCTVPLFPGTRAPSAHVTTPPTCVHPLVQLTYVVFAGAASVIVTLAAGSSPVTAQLIVYVNSWPAWMTLAALLLSVNW